MSVKSLVRVISVCEASNLGTFVSFVIVKVFIPDMEIKAQSFRQIRESVKEFCFGLVNAFACSLERGNSFIIHFHELVQNT